MKKLLILMVGISGLLVGCGAQEDMTSEPATTTDAAATTNSTATETAPAATEE